MIFRNDHILVIVCDDKDHKMYDREREFTGTNFLHCKRKAQKEGWTFIFGKTFCPVCSKKLKIK